MEMKKQKKVKKATKIIKGYIYVYMYVYIKIVFYHIHHHNICYVFSNFIVIACKNPKYIILIIEKSISGGKMEDVETRVKKVKVRVSVIKLLLCSTWQFTGHFN